MPATSKATRPRKSVSKPRLTPVPKPRSRPKQSAVVMADALGPRTFAEYEAVVEQTDERKSKLISLLGLVGEIGDLHSMVKKMFLQKSNASFRRQLAEELGDVLWYLTSLCVRYEIPLQEVAQRNATKASAFFSEGRVPAFDAQFPKDEQFPRKLRVVFTEKKIAGKGVSVKMTINGIAVGDPLTDNSSEDDGYRFHDVFHLAFASVLGWSPVTRALLKVKRKSDQRIDEVQDGARAAIVEEAVSVFIFNRAEEHGWYRDPETVDMALIKMIKQLTLGLEVSTCTAKQWKRAIHQGYAAFERLSANHGGTIVADLDKQSLEYAAS
jgi:NTP pyrophosphatase (non-canonical NTP hydrolase)